jgi:thiol-disulfide isomerase/thioredoxin
VNPIRLLPFVSIAVLSLGCPPSEPPNPPPHPPSEPLVIGKSPPSAPVAVDPAPARPRGPSRGPKAPPIMLDSLTTQEKVTIPPDKVVIVDFWATWCAPCAKAMPKLQELYAKYKSSGLEVIAIAVDDDKSGVADFARRHGARFPVGWDDGHQLTESFKVQSMPSTYIIDRDGSIVHVHAGYHDGEAEEIEREIKALF